MSVLLSLEIHSLTLLTEQKYCSICTIVTNYLVIIILIHVGYGHPRWQKVQILAVRKYQFFTSLQCKISPCHKKLQGYLQYIYMNRKMLHEKT